MPYHKIPKASIAEDLRAIEREGEHVVSVTADGTFFHVFTVYPEMTTRVAEYNNVFGGGTR